MAGFLDSVTSIFGGKGKGNFFGKGLASKWDLMFDDKIEAKKQKEAQAIVKQDDQAFKKFTEQDSLFNPAYNTELLTPKYMGDTKKKATKTYLDAFNKRKQALQQQTAAPGIYQTRLS